jgi:hypothetical protein
MYLLDPVDVAEFCVLSKLGKAIACYMYPTGLFFCLLVMNRISPHANEIKKLRFKCHDQGSK